MSQNPLTWFNVSSLAKLFAICAMSVFLAGCGDGRPKRVAVSGSVFIDGKPLKAGSITLVPKGERPSTGAIDSKGHFNLTCFDENDGAVRGRHSVQVVGVEEIDSETVRWLAPKKYADYHTSGVAVDVDGPTDALRIDLKWDGGAPFTEKLHPPVSP